MPMPRLVRILDDTVMRLGGGQLTQCSTHRPCEDRRIAARRLMAVRDTDDEPELRRSLAAAYGVEKRHPAFQAVAPSVSNGTGVPGIDRLAQKKLEAQLWTLTYISQAPHAPSPDELQSILEVSRRNNDRLDITGVLQSSGTNYSQTLEGPRRRRLSSTPPFVAEYAEYSAKAICDLRDRSFAASTDRDIVAELMGSQFVECHAPLRVATLSDRCAAQDGDVAVSSVDTDPAEQLSYGLERPHDCPRQGSPPPRHRGERRGFRPTATPLFLKGEPYEAIDRLVPMPRCSDSASCPKLPR